ncbi:MAG: nucleotidyltransferase domain-containing protein, partial [Fusobacteriota bacterium]
MRYGLKKETLKKITSIFSGEEKVQKVILYGSRAKGNYRKGSDIDITLIGENINLEDLNRLSIKLDDLLLPYTFD